MTEAVLFDLDGVLVDSETRFTSWRPKRSRRAEDWVATTIEAGPARK
jgi:beta-phosphoglucomutase-like phosphatase (HAD superfamily)